MSLKISTHFSNFTFNSIFSNILVQQETLPLFIGTVAVAKYLVKIKKIQKNEETWLAHVYKDLGPLTSPTNIVAAR